MTTDVPVFCQRCYSDGHYSDDCPTRNEAAERLRSILNANGAAPHLLDEALAAERSAGEREARRATVERIRERIEDRDPLVWNAVSILAILDEEAAR